MNDRTTVLVTGSDGFIGRHLVPYLAAQGYKVIAASRAAAAFEGPNIVAVALPDLSVPFDWQPMLQQCDAVVHLAGIAHTFADEDLYDRVNHRATEALALAAFRRNVHLVFISSIAAQSGSFSDHELTEDDLPRPNNAYGRSKLAAEQAVRATGVSFTILRPVVIYGDGEKGNFATVHKISRLPIPLPFGALTAQRSVLSVQNFNSAVATALTNSRARGEIFIVSDPKTDRKSVV
jgi:UDP-glucose 4-epimerase